MAKSVATPQKCPFCRVSSAVEQRFCKPLVGGSIPSPGTSKTRHLAHYRHPQFQAKIALGKQWGKQSADGGPWRGGLPLPPPANPLYGSPRASRGPTNRIIVLVVGVGGRHAYGMTKAAAHKLARLLRHQGYKVRVRRHASVRGQAVKTQADTARGILL